MAMMTALLCIVLVIACTVAAANIASSQARQRVETGMSTLSGFMAWRLESFMLERYRDIQNLTTLEPLLKTWTSGTPDEIRSVLDDLQASYPGYTWLGFVRPDGTVLAATKGMLEGVSVADRAWFQHALEGPAVEDVHGARRLADLLEPTVSGEPYRFVDVAFPVTDANGRLVGVIGAQLSWAFADEIRRAMLELMDPTLRTNIWILRSDGRTLLGPAFDSTPFAAETIASINHGLARPFVAETGEPTLTAATKAAEDTQLGLGWIVVARRPVSAALASVDQLTASIFVAGLVLAILGVVLAWLASRRVTNPLRALAQQVDRIGRDPSATMIYRERGSSDVLTLSSAVRSLLRRIGTAQEAQVNAERAQDALQQRMEEKTRTFGEHINTLQELADTDPLTHLLNRRAFLTFAADAMSYFHRYGRGIAILVVDIDFFKRVNDTFGHGVGDDVIETVGTAIAGEVRTTDKVARFGGEEFVVLLRETDHEGAFALADRIRIKVGDTVLDARGHSGINVTVSIGLAMAAEGDADISDVVERADRALYYAKSSGRNRVVSDGDAEALSTAAE
jgi:diguanylate cyclase (GGDEF)-like protein